MSSTNPTSIRQIVLNAIARGASNEEIEQEIVKFHPNSMAAKKSAKHIAWYRAQVKKEAKNAIAPKQGQDLPPHWVAAMQA